MEDIWYCTDDSRSTIGTIWWDWIKLVVSIRPAMAIATCLSDTWLSSDSQLSLPGYQKHGYYDIWISDTWLSLLGYLISLLEYQIYDYHYLDKRYQALSTQTSDTWLHYFNIWYLMIYLDIRYLAITTLIYYYLVIRHLIFHYLDILKYLAVTILILDILPSSYQWDRCNHKLIPCYFIS